MFKLLVGALFISFVIVLMAFTSTYIGGTASRELLENIDETTDSGSRANETMQSRTKDFQSDVTIFMTMSWIFVITLPLAAIIIYRKLLP